MKKTLIMAICLLSALIVSAREPQRGYRGFVDVGFSAGNIHYFSDSRGEYIKDGTAYLDLSTSHGYQINNHFFVGAGLTLIGASPSGQMFPVFGEFRYDTSFGKFTPYADFRIGYSLADPGFYMAPSVGYRFNWGRRINLNLGLGMTLKGQQIHGKDYGDPMLTVRFGVDF